MKQSVIDALRNIQDDKFISENYESLPLLSLHCIAEIVKAPEENRVFWLKRFNSAHDKKERSIEYRRLKSEEDKCRLEESIKSKKNPIAALAQGLDDFANRHGQEPACWTQWRRASKQRAQQQEPRG